MLYKNDWQVNKTDSKQHSWSWLNLHFVIEESRSLTGEGMVGFDHKPKYTERKM